MGIARGGRNVRWIREGYSRDRAVKKRDEVGACRSHTFPYFVILELEIIQGVLEINILPETDLTNS